ncbi:arginine--tRNA ligase [Candidatus Peregrinibacteria bacterium CG10_big_fil_rev_8_21_14_0_10_49_10]|nr:MAG: arginine--tRNA ligase [Candidatus Peregrinibacteria bacterium CG10_big_fil_rev_8_21_14_0_10_49_10]
MLESLTKKAQVVLRDSFGVADVPLEWHRPQDISHGDASSAVALRIAKQTGKKPREVAEELCNALSAVEEVEKAEVAGPGYVNVWLTPAALLQALNETREACTARVKRSGEQPVIVEYSAPNIAKPLGIHHILSTVIGQSLANLHRHLGYEVVAINHLGDWGTQFGKLAVAMQSWSEKPVEECTLDELLALYVRFHEEAEKDASLDDKARAAFKKIESGDAELRAFWKEVVRITMEQLNVLYARLHVSFDYTHGESFYEDKMQPILEEGKKKGVFKEGREGALIAEFPEETNLSPAIVLKADDATIYFTRDLATARYRIDTFHPREMLYVVDIAQEYYFKQLFAALEQLEWELPHMEHVVFGRMGFADGQMSTRKGNIVRLEHVLDEAFKRAEKVIQDHGDAIQTDDPHALAEMMGVGAVVYSVLSQNRKMNMTFDWEKALSFDGNSAPYLQYTHARARSVLRKADEDVSDFPTSLQTLVEKERTLVGTLLEFSRILEEARVTRMPHTLANYLYRLCQDYNAFYNDLPILKAEGPSRPLRLALTQCTASVLKAGAEILTLRVPECM